MDVETHSEVLSSPLTQPGSAVFLLQTDQNLVLWFGHVKYILQHRKNVELKCLFAPTEAVVRRLGVKRHLGVL